MCLGAVKGLITMRVFGWGPGALGTPYPDVRLCAQCWGVMRVYSVLHSLPLFAGSIAATDTAAVGGKDSEDSMSYIHIGDSDKRNLAS